VDSERTGGFAADVLLDVGAAAGRLFSLSPPSSSSALTTADDDPLFVFDFFFDVFSLRAAVTRLFKSL
jgi:hypothetical protein